MPWILVHTKSYVHPPRVESLFPPVLWNCCTQALHACMRTCVLNHFSHVQLFVTPWTTAHQAPLSMGFSRQEYSSGLPCPPQGDLPDSGIEPASLRSPALAGGFCLNTGHLCPILFSSLMLRQLRPLSVTPWGTLSKSPSD